MLICVSTSLTSRSGLPPVVIAAQCVEDKESKSILPRHTRLRVGLTKRLKQRQAKRERDTRPEFPATGSSNPLSLDLDDLEASSHVSMRITIAAIRRPSIYYLLLAVADHAATVPIRSNLSSASRPNGRADRVIVERSLINTRRAPLLTQLLLASICSSPHSSQTTD